MPGRVGVAGSTFVARAQQAAPLRRALLALLAVAVLLLPLPLGDQVADAGATCCGEASSLRAAAPGADERCDDCGAPSVSAGDDAAHHPCCSDGCHCACCGRLPLDVVSAGTTSPLALRRLVEARLPRAPADPAPLAIFDPPRA